MHVCLMLLRDVIGGLETDCSLIYEDKFSSRQGIDLNSFYGSARSHSQRWLLRHVAHYQHISSLETRTPPPCQQ